MLRLSPSDRMAQRTWLGSLLNRQGRYSDALFFAQAWLNLGGNADSPPRGGTLFREPSYDLLSPESEDRFEYSIGALIYSAALAAFKLKGDCPLSQQYLRIAAKANSHVLVKVLARISKPSEWLSSYHCFSLVVDSLSSASLNMNGRQHNGPEDAHDYLWLTQDLWMEDDVWHWVNDNADVKRLVTRNCSREGCQAKETKAAEFQRCGACRLVRLYLQSQLLLT